MCRTKENSPLRSGRPLFGILGRRNAPGEARMHKEKGPPEAGLSNYRLSTGGGLRRQVPWLVH